MNSPCLYCDDRTDRCHSKCKKYLKYKSILNSKKLSARRRELGERELLGYKGSKKEKRYESI